MTSVYDFRATPLVNLVADQAMSMINQLLAENASQPVDMRRICCWSVDAVAPLAGQDLKAGLAHEAAIVIQHALALDRMVPAVRGRAA
jgi:hypothetical protein